MQLNKKDMRNEVLRQLNAIHPDEHQKLSENIKNTLIKEDVYRQAKVIGITMSRFPEVDTIPIIQAAWADGKQVAVPKCIRSTREMDFRIINHFDELETVYMDLLEPIVEKTMSIQKEQIDLQIVPGVVFSKQGYRIGFGVGYYDRYMKDYEGASLSLAFSYQMNDDVPVEPHDIPVQRILVESVR